MLKQCLNCGLEFDGAPQSRFHSDACRKAYSRKLGLQDSPQELEAGHLLASEPGQQSEKEEPGQALSAEQEQPRRTRTPSISEEEYVRMALSRNDLFDRARAERYARWRYREFCAGEVASL